MRMKQRKYALDAHEKERIVAAIKGYLQGGHGDVIAAYIFGSFAGDREFRDVDIGLLFRRMPDVPVDCELRMEVELQDLLKMPTDVRILNDAPVAFAQSVLRRRLLVVDKDPNARAAFEGKVLKEYFDFVPFRNRYLKETLHAPI
jgi:hypothetical protein